MDNTHILYFNGKSARATQVRVLVFNESVNLYTNDNNDFIVSYPVKGTTVTRTGSDHFFYFDQAGTAYLQLHSDHQMVQTLLKEVADSNDTWIARLMKQKIALLVAVMVALVIGVYFLLINVIPLIGSAMVSRNSEIQMGNALKDIMVAEEELVGSYVDYEGTEKLQAFADKLKLSQEYPIRVTLLHSDLVNAYALPGGQIVVYSGMLEKISDPGSLVALLAHEASHVNHRHSLRSLMRSAANGILVSIVFNDATGISATLLGHAETLRGLQYSRTIETEADDFGMQLMLINGVDPSGMKELMQLFEEEGDVPESMAFLSSHPLTRKRIKAAESFIEKHPFNKSINPQIAAAFSELKAKSNQ